MLAGNRQIQKITAVQLTRTLGKLRLHLKSDCAGWPGLHLRGSCVHTQQIHSNGERRGKTLGGIRKSYSQQHSTKRRRWSKEAHHRMRNSTAPSYMRNSTGGTVEGARSEGKVEWPFKKETQNGLLTCSQCADHQWMLPPVPGCGPCRYHCNVTKTGAKKRAASWDSSFSSTPSPS